MIQLSRAQDEEVGDGTTSVIILAGEMLQASGVNVCTAPAAAMQALPAARLHRAFEVAALPAMTPQHELARMGD
jgi:chaperonin GroEL (HSP60 family)